jgi:hypothetical protein
MKSAIDKMFFGPSWMKPIEIAATDTAPARTKERDFLSNIRSERFRFVPDAAFASGEAVLAPEKIPSLHNASFLTDGYGPSCALAQVAALLFEPSELQAEAERVDVAPTSGT